MARIGIIFAMEKEIKLFAESLSNLTYDVVNGRKFFSGEYGKHNLTALVCGIGKVNAALGTADLINIYDCEIIINIGISGGLDASLHVGEMIVGTQIVYHDVWCGEPNAYGQIQEMPLLYHSDADLIKKLPPFKSGLICCGDKFIESSKEKSAILKQFPSVLAVDMESAAIAQTCYIYNIPLLCIRQISDVPGVNNHSEQYADFWQNAPQNAIEILKQILVRI